MKKTFLLILFFFTLIFGKNWSGTLSAQWTAQTAPVGTGSLFSVFAISPTSVACAGLGGVLVSIDSGVTWAFPINFGINFYTVHSGSAANWLSISQQYGYMMKVQNPSENVNLSFGGPDSITALHFNTPSCVTAVGSRGQIKTSCDTGVTWQLRLPVSLALNSVWYANANKGIACGVFGEIKRTVNGGVTWATVASGATQNLNGVTFADSLTGYIVGNAGTFLKTTNGGASWTSMPLSITNDLNGVYFVSPDTGYVVGTSGLIKKTFDGGTTWTTMTSGTTVTLRSVHFVNSVTGWVCGDGATVLKYCPTLFMAGGITGNTTVCAGDTLTYSTPAVTGASGYLWSFPAGWSGISTTNTITLTAGNSGGNINVATTNACGNGIPVSTAVIVNSPPVPVITLSSFNTLTSSAATGNQWYLNGIAISGATGHTYTFTSNGTYTVVVTSGSCSPQSLPLVINNAGVDELSDNSQLFIYPNPTNGIFQLTIANTLLNMKTVDLRIKITDILGNIIFQTNVINCQTKMDLSDKAKGIYFVQLIDENRIQANRKMVIQ